LLLYHRPIHKNNITSALLNQRKESIITYLHHSLES
jgi:hypothetical protein